MFVCWCVFSTCAMTGNNADILRFYMHFLSFRLSLSLRRRPYTLYLSVYLLFPSSRPLSLGLTLSPGLASFVLDAWLFHSLDDIAIAHIYECDSAGFIVTVVHVRHTTYMDVAAIQPNTTRSRIIFDIDKFNNFRVKMLCIHVVCFSLVSDLLTLSWEWHQAYRTSMQSVLNLPLNTHRTYTGKKTNSPSLARMWIYALFLLFLLFHSLIQFRLGPQNWWKCVY